jgi:type IV pilus assembly protein PilN
MIKVNLLKDHTVPTRHITVAPTTSPMGWLMLAAMALVLVGVGGTWYFLNQQIRELSDTKTRLTAENDRLQGLKKQIDQYEKMKREREGRIEVIKQLKANQSGPVNLMNHVIHSIPVGAVLWLTSIDQKGSQVRITGFTQRGETIPDFMSNLSATGFFKSVDLELYEDQLKGAARFTLVCVGTSKTVAE